jgi:hypothetical protein
LLPRRLKPTAEVLLSPVHHLDLYVLADAFVLINPVHPLLCYTPVEVTRKMGMQTDVALQYVRSQRLFVDVSIISPRSTRILFTKLFLQHVSSNANLLYIMNVLVLIPSVVASFALLVRVQYLFLDDVSNIRRFTIML